MAQFYFNNVNSGASRNPEYGRAVTGLITWAYFYLLDEGISLQIEDS